MADVTQQYTVVTQAGELAIAGNSTYIVDRYVPVYDFRLDSNLDARLLRARRQAGNENLVDYMTNTWSQVYPNGLPLASTDVYLWDPNSSTIDWTYGVAKSFIGLNQGGFSIGDIEVTDPNLNPGDPGYLLQPLTEVGSQPTNLEGLAGYQLGDVLYNTSATDPIDYKFFNNDMFVANSSSPQANAVRVLDDNGLFPDDNAYLFTDGGYDEPNTTINTYNLFDAGDFNLTQTQADAICYKNVEAYQTILTDEATDTQIPGFRFNVRFNQNVGSVKFNKFILFGINTRITADGKCEKYGDYFPFAVTVLPITQLKTDVIGHGIEEFNLNTQIVITQSAYNNNKLILDNCCWTKLNRFQTSGTGVNDECISALPGCGPNAATLAWDKNAYIGTRSADIFISGDADEAKLLISDGGPFVTYEDTPGSLGSVVDLQKPQLALGNKNLGESTIDTNRSFWKFSYIGEGENTDSHDLVLMPKNTREQFLADYGILYSTDGAPLGVDPSNPGSFYDHPVTQNVTPNTSWVLTGGDQSASNINRLFPAVSFGKEGKLFNEYYGSSTRVNQYRSLPASDFIGNNIFMHNLPVTTTGWPLDATNWPSVDALPEYSADDIVLKARNNLILSSGDDVVIPTPNALSVSLIKDNHEIAAGYDYLNPAPEVRNDFGISFKEVVQVNEVDNYAASSRVQLNLKSREDDAVGGDLYGLNMHLRFTADGLLTDYDPNSAYSTTGPDIYNGIIIDAETSIASNLPDVNPYIDIFNLRNLYGNDETNFFSAPNGIEFSEKVFNPDVETVNRDGIITFMTKSRWTENDVEQNYYTLGVNLEPNTVTDPSSDPGVTQTPEVNIRPEYDTDRINILDLGLLAFKTSGLITANEDFVLSAYDGNTLVNLTEKILFSDVDTDARTYNTHFELFSVVKENGVTVDEEYVGLEFVPTGYYDTDPSILYPVLFNQVDIKPDDNTDKINIFDLGQINSTEELYIYANAGNNNISFLDEEIFQDVDTLAKAYPIVLNTSTIWEESAIPQAELNTGIKIIPDMEHVPASTPGIAYSNSVNIEPTDTTDAINLIRTGLITGYANELSYVNFFDDTIFTSGGLNLNNYSLALKTASSETDAGGIITAATNPGLIIEANSYYDSDPSILTELINEVNIRPDNETDGINLLGLKTVTFIDDINFGTSGNLILSSHNDSGIFTMTETILFQDVDTDARTYNAEFYLKSTWTENGVLAQEENVGIRFIPAGEKIPASDPGIVLYDELDIRPTTTTSRINYVDIGYLAGNNLEIIYDDISTDDLISAFNTRILATSTFSSLGVTQETNTTGIDISTDAYYNFDSALPILADNAVIKPSPGTNSIIMTDVSAMVNTIDGMLISATGDITIDAPNVYIPNFVITQLSALTGISGYFEVDGANAGLEIVNTGDNSVGTGIDILMQSQDGGIIVEADTNVLVTSLTSTVDITAFESITLDAPAVYIPNLALDALESIQGLAGYVTTNGSTYGVEMVNVDDASFSTGNPDLLIQSDAGVIDMKAAEGVNISSYGGITNPNGSVRIFTGSAAPSVSSGDMWIQSQNNAEFRGLGEAAVTAGSNIYITGGFNATGSPVNDGNCGINFSGGSNTVDLWAGNGASATSSQSGTINITCNNRNTGNVGHVKLESYWTTSGGVDNNMNYVDVNSGSNSVDIFSDNSVSINSNGNASINAASQVSILADTSLPFPSGAGQIVMRSNENMWLICDSYQRLDSARAYMTAGSLSTGFTIDAGDFGVAAQNDVYVASGNDIILDPASSGGYTYIQFNGTWYRGEVSGSQLVFNSTTSPY